MWNVSKNVMGSLKTITNKFAVLQEDYNDEIPHIISPIKQVEVDKFLKYRRKPTDDDSKEWGENIKKYFEFKWKAIEKEDEKIQEGVFDDYSKLDEFLKENELRNEGQNKLISSTRILAMFVLRLLAAGNGSLTLSIVIRDSKLFNNGGEKRKLWKDLRMHKYIVNGKPWGMMGDMNVTLKINEHSEGMSHSTLDMQEFQECVAEIEMEDINTIVNLLRSKLANVQKKLDMDCHNNNLNEEAADTLTEYNEVVKNEENMFYQQVKVERLKEKDNNTAYFHQVIKGRKHKSHIDIMCDDSGVRYEGNVGNTKSVGHFQVVIVLARSLCND
ncbi:hypothetical protein Tco_0287197 [Tanacetum coccineum]